MPRPPNASTNVSARSRPLAGTMSPNPIVKNTTPEKYRASPGEARGTAKEPRRAHQMRDHPTISVITHSRSRPISEAGPNADSTISRRRSWRMWRNDPHSGQIAR